MMAKAKVVSLFVVLACDSTPAPMHPSLPSASSVRGVSLPGATGPVTVDYIAYEPSHGSVWIPVGETGSVDVFNIAADGFVRIDGFKTAVREVRGKSRTMGPSSVTFSKQLAYVGNRASSEVCVVDLASTKLGACTVLAAQPDGIAYVGVTAEVWATTPKDESITVLDASSPELKPKLTIKLEGGPEGYAVDEARGVFYTNLEDKNRTVLLDAKTHTVKATWALTCQNGPRGITTDPARPFVYVACTDGVLVLNADQGTVLGRLDTGDGVDDIKWVEGIGRLVVAAGKAGRVTMVKVDEHGVPSAATTMQTATGARNAVGTPNGTAYVVDPQGAKLLILTPS